MQINFSIQTLSLIKNSLYNNIFSGEAKHVVKDQDEDICTHIVYAFATLDTSKHEMKVFDRWLDIELKNYEQFKNLKNRKPDVKLYIAIGGWTDSQENAGAYKAMFKSLMKRKNFARYVCV